MHTPEELALTEGYSILRPPSGIKKPKAFLTGLEKLDSFADSVDIIQYNELCTIWILGHYLPSLASVSDLMAENVSFPNAHYRGHFKYITC